MTLAITDAAQVELSTGITSVRSATGARSTVLVTPAVTQELPAAIRLVCGLTGNRLRPRHVVAEALVRALSEADQAAVARQVIGRVDDRRGGETYWHSDGSGVTLTSTVVPLQVRLPVDLVDMVVALAMASARTFDQVVTEALTRYLPIVFREALAMSVIRNSELATWPAPVIPGIRRVRGS